MKIVTDGKYYAIQKGWLFKRYLCVRCFDWWSLKDSYIYYNRCWVTLEHIEETIKMINRKKDIKFVCDVKDNH